MRKTAAMLRNKWLVIITALSLGMMGSLTMPFVANAIGPGTVCVLQFGAAGGEVLGVLVDQPQNFNIAVLTAADKNVNVPITCDSLDTLSVAVANQKNSWTEVTALLFTNDGELSCFVGQFSVPPNGARGFLLSGCQ
jgi:hypothetical protein